MPFISQLLAFVSNPRGAQFAVAFAVAVAFAFAVAVAVAFLAVIPQGICFCLFQLNFFSAFLAQKSHVKPQNHSSH